MVLTLASSAGSIAQVRCAMPEYSLPTCSRSCSRPPLARLEVRPSFSRPGQTPCRGWSISGQIQAMASLSGCSDLFFGQNGRKVRLTVNAARLEFSAWAASG